MFCQNCGNNLAEGVMFCAKCGARADTPMNGLRTPSQDIPVRLSGDMWGWQYYMQPWPVSPYYQVQFGKIASGQKPNFNWAAFFLGGYNQLYNGCTKIFCRTYLPLYIMSAAVNFMSVLGQRMSSAVLVIVALVLSMILSACGIGLAVSNGLKFNEWYYKDITENPERKNGTKWLVILIVCQMLVTTVVNIFARL